MTDIEAIHPPPERLSAYAQGRLHGPEMDEIERHMSSCDSFTRDGRRTVWGGSEGVIRMYRLPAPDQDKADQPATPAEP